MISDGVCLLAAHIRATLLQYESCAIIYSVFKTLRLFEGLVRSSLVARFLIEASQLIVDAAVLIGKEPQFVFRDC